MPASRFSESNPFNPSVAAQIKPLQPKKLSGIEKRISSAAYAPAIN